MAGKKVAVIVAFLLAAVAVAALVLVAVNDTKSTNHQAFCRQYKDSLTLDFSDAGRGSISTSGLSGSDAAGVAKDEHTYQRAYAKASSPEALQKDFDAYVRKTIPQMVAAKGC